MTCRPGRLGDPAQGERVRPDADAAGVDDRAATRRGKATRLLDGQRLVVEDDVVAVAEVVAPDPGEVVEAYRFVGEQPTLVASWAQRSACQGR